METGKSSGLPSSSTLIGAVMRGNQGDLLVRLAWPFLITFESSLLLGARPSKRKIDDGNPLKDERKRKKAKPKSTILPDAQVIELDVPTPSAATTTPNPPSTSHVPYTVAVPSPVPRPPSAPGLGVSTSMQGRQTDTCDTAPEKSSPSPSDHSPHPSVITPPACVLATPLPTPSPPTPTAPSPCMPDLAPTAPAAPAANAPLPPSTAHPPTNVATANECGRQGRPRRILVGLSQNSSSFLLINDIFR